jgi:hypothetical protein
MKFYDLYNNIRVPKGSLLITVSAGGSAGNGWTKLTAENK